MKQDQILFSKGIKLEKEKYKCDKSIKIGINIFWDCRVFTNLSHMYDQLLFVRMYGWIKSDDFNESYQNNGNRIFLL